jgi:hypothetical protein
LQEFGLAGCGQPCPYDLVVFMDCSFLTGCAREFWQITSGVCRAVGACLGGGGKPATLPQDLVEAAYRRVAVAQSRLLALMERVRKGMLRGGWRRPAATSPRPGFGGSREMLHRPEIVLPRRFGWLVHLVGYEAAGRGAQLSHLLGDPEMVALVADVPQARRILAPLCRMLGVECAGLRAVPRVVVRKAASRKDASSRRRAEILAPERVGYVPSAKWPKGVISPGVVRIRPV